MLERRVSSHCTDVTGLKGRIEELEAQVEQERGERELTRDTLQAKLAEKEKDARLAEEQISDLAGQVKTEVSKLAKAEKVMEWYAEKARALAGWDRRTPSVKLEAIFTELSLDGGKRAAALAEHDKEKA